MSQKKRILTLKEKIKIVEFYTKHKVSARVLGKTFKIGKSQAATIINKRNELLKE